MKFYDESIFNDNNLDDGIKQTLTSELSSYSIMMKVANEHNKETDENFKHSMISAVDSQEYFKYNDKE